MTQKLTKFLSSLFLALLFLAGFSSCKNEDKKNVDTAEQQTDENIEEELFFKLSLAQWSLSRPIFEGEMDPLDFAEKANELGFEGIEYVSGLYNPWLEKAGNSPEAMQSLLDTLKNRSNRYNVENVLIMVDGEGDLAIPNEEERNQAVENHKKWVDAASFLGAKAIRVNLFGSDKPEEWKAASIDGLKKLSDYAAGKNINVLVENHGYLSSNAALLVEVMEGVNMENCGTLPDFGNFCLKREGGERWEAACVDEYPKYQGVEEMMPHAMAVSAKSYEFDENGQETSIDYGRMLQIVKDAGYTGYIGVEFEGQDLSAEEGIIATRDLLIEEGQKLNN
ncbi:sugar phosphate isomerase/epimerase [Antarcticibacterium flavum]|uniref:Sugar phosphate isomerase/epimerase n=1 Tax=Antarcticibacterium flavum TaxID=2058175 RepID=A0A5B7X732_9FLAO|nr:MULTISPECIES: sugar phosphate isomerase/epimerase family protein [Antarcticibacterium]MCM4160641.1 xylose isomerase [Antarcticibacterium sp. W02-3]QCY71209.1 sugar phosphate isomerase/epimerase [Antarcticibacterium flavum]